MEIQTKVTSMVNVETPCILFVALLHEKWEQTVKSFEHSNVIFFFVFFNLTVVPKVLVFTKNETLVECKSNMIYCRDTNSHD